MFRNNLPKAKHGTYVINLDENELLTLVHKKSDNTSKIYLIIFVGISEVRETFLASKTRISFSMFCVVTSVKEKLFLPLYLLWIARMLGWFLHLIMDFKVGS